MFANFIVQCCPEISFYGEMLSEDYSVHEQTRSSCFSTTRAGRPAEAVQELAKVVGSKSIIIVCALKAMVAAMYE